jgi:hypothetical protein
VTVFAGIWIATTAPRERPVKQAAVVPQENATG